jgi:hypothetical protein
MFDSHVLVYLKHRFTLVQVSQSGLNGHPLIDELTPSLCGFTFDVILQNTSSFLLVSHRLLEEGADVWSRYGGPLRHR